MNIILFTQEELNKASLPSGDIRATHIIEVLKLQQNEVFNMGIIDGPRGEGRLLGKDEQGSLLFSFKLTDETPSLYPITLIVGLPRPQMAKRIMRDATTLGVQRMIFFNSERGTKSYAQSPIWDPRHIRELLIEGAQQAVCTRLPEIKLTRHLKAALSAGLSATSWNVACDNEEAAISLISCAGQLTRPENKGKPIVVVIGSERGLSHGERSLLHASGFTLVGLGPRILRTETACISALSILLAKSGYLG